MTNEIDMLEIENEMKNDKRRVNKNKISVKKNKDDKLVPKIIEIKPYYIVRDANGFEEYFSTLGDIADDKNTNISNISHLSDGKKVKGLNFDVIKEDKPYVYTFVGIRYESKNIKAMSEICKLSISTIHKIITEFVKNN